MRILITGAAGYIGSYLAKKLSNQELILVDNYSNIDDKRQPFFEINENKILKADISNSDTCESITKNIDIIYHLAGVSGIQKCEEPESYISNVIGTTMLGIWAEKNNVKKIIFASTSAVYGECQAPIITENHRVKPRSRYGWQKYASELILQSLKIPCIIFRKSNVYGEGLFHKQTAVDNFIDKAKEGLNLTINGKGLQRRDYLHITDCVNAYLCAIYWDSGVYNIGGNDNLSINELADLVITIAKEYKINLNKVYRDNIDSGAMLKNFKYDYLKARERGYSPKERVENEIRRRFSDNQNIPEKD